jgi:hypothetical protein
MQQISQLINIFDYAKYLRLTMLNWVINILLIDNFNFTHFIIVIERLSFCVYECVQVPKYNFSSDCFYGLLRFNTFALSRKSIKVLLLNYSWLCYLLEWLLVTPIFDSLSSINILSWSLSLIKGRTPGFLLFSLNVNYCKQSHKSFIFWNMSWVCWSRHSNLSNCWYIY